MSTTLDVLAPFMVDAEAGTGLLDSSDCATASMIARRAGCTDDTLLLALALAVWAHRSGHACLELQSLTDTLERAVARTGQQWDLPPMPSPAMFEHSFRDPANASLVRVLDSPGTAAEAMADTRPLVFLDDRFTSQRQFADEVHVAESIRSMIARPSDLSGPAATAFIDRELEVSEDDDRQNLVAKSVLAAAFTVLTGGPGTGKTYTLTRCLLAFLIAAEERGEPVSIAVCAPTGKAATRAKELLSEFVGRLEGQRDRPSDAVLSQLRSIEPTTIHGLLGTRRLGGTRFTHDRDHPLPHDLVIVDETSMVPLQMMSRLFEALGPRSRLLLVGDDAQLESVESGSVLRDLVASSALLDDSVFELQKVRRVGDDNPIAVVAPLIRRGEAELALAALRDSAPRLRFIETSGSTPPDDSVIDGLVATYRTARDLARTTDPAHHERALHLISASRLLCGARRGPVGVEQWNDIVDRRLRLRRGDQMAVGRALMVTVNSPRMNLVNGDVGIVVETNEGPMVYFRSENMPRYVSPVDLPPVERAFATTVHKSQGSEYDELVVVLLPDVGSPLLTRELLYTALTRGGGDAVIVGSAEAFLGAVQNPSVRVSGLRQLLT